ncbi:MFS transporter [Sinomicrobium weinanense]|uniref:MFS transporter n=1 Tax=Sinomicrobium weinanense TaxID=2842200 RepID=A0A926JV38_9FLAO|nr:MFS transporter [Sinomicrobium weinanense]MBC9797757.1 MFS transporter [Sinomicrobium weinanense]MBU3125978.1 MFS transporter [Sinomicrobium weinanense]
MKRSKRVVGAILLIWFVISFVTNILGPLMPIIIKTYELSLTMAAFLPFSFFLAYGIMSIPSGMLIERIGEKKSMLIAFGLNFTGAVFFSFYPSYEIALVSLFAIGAGMAMLQVIINPLMRTAGGEENFAFFSVMGQLVFGLASFLSPFVFSYLVRTLSEHPEVNIITASLAKLVGDNPEWTALYWIFTLIFIFMFTTIYLLKIPVVKLKEDEKTGAVETYIILIKKKQVLLFFLAMVAYVGTEQALANWMSEFLNTYHGFEPESVGAGAVGWFWGLMSAGCLLGLFLLKLWGSKRVLKMAVICTLVVFSMAVFGPGEMALYAFPVTGFFISVMFSIIFSLALNSMAVHHGSFAGILCSGIFGGALIPLIIGALGDWLGLRTAFLFIYITLGYIYFISVYAKPLVDNKTLKVSELLNMPMKTEKV